MRTRIVVGVALVIGMLGVGVYASRAGEAIGRTQWALVNFTAPVQVTDHLVMGPVLIVHDSEKMARGEPCTTFYRFEPGKGPKEPLVSFHCRPAQRELVERTTLNVVNSPAGCKRLTEYQIGGDTEGHGVPSK